MEQAHKMVDYSNQTISVGIDVHLTSWYITVYFDRLYIKSFRQDPCPDKLYSYLARNFPGGKYRCAYESGFCGYWILRRLEELGVECIVVNPADVPQTNKGQSNKTDKVDSKRLAIALESGMLKGIYIPDIEQQADRQLLRMSEKVGCEIRDNKRRIKGLLHHIGVKIPTEFSKGNWSVKYVRWLEGLELQHKSFELTVKRSIQTIAGLHEQQRLIFKDITEMTKKERYVKLVPLLKSVPGVGRLTAVTLAVEIGDMNRFANFDSLNSYIGLCPNEFSSGEKEKKGKMSYRKHNRIRSLLIENAWTSVRIDPALSLCYRQLCRRVTNKRAIIIIARKILSRIRKVWMDGKPYESGIEK